MFLGLPDPDPSIIILFVTLFDFLSLKNDVNIASKSNKQKKLCKKFVFCWHLEGQSSISQRHGSADPDPPQNVMDPQHCFTDYQRADLLLGSSGGEPSEGEVEQGSRTPRHQDCLRTTGQGRQPSNSFSSVTFYNFFTADPQS
jgi:hypothetical protein